MTNTTHTIQNYLLDSRFVNLVTETLLPVTGVDADDFWADLIRRLDGHSATTAIETATDQSRAISLLDPRLVLRSLNSRWGSLYSALYNADTIPQSAGLKIGNKYNAARGNRVTTYAREFLDSACPLSEGSHKDVVTYMVYFQNLMAILADGSTVGLRNQSQFVGKNGPKSEPDSILLQHQNLHIEILFDRNGVRGSQDLSNIEDIQIEAPEAAILSLEADTVEQKCETYSNLLELARGSLKTTFDTEGTPATRRLNRSTPYTLKDGEEIEVSCTNEAQIDLIDTTTELGMICNSEGVTIPQRIVDEAVSSWIADAFAASDSTPTLLLNVGKSSTARDNCKKTSDQAKVSSLAAETLPSEINHTANSRIHGNANDNNKGVYRGSPVMSALHRHGFTQH